MEGQDYVNRIFDELEGVDDFLALLGESDDSREDIDDIVDDLLGNEEDRSTNAGTLKFFETLVETSKGKIGFSAPIRLELLSAESGELTDDEIAMEANREVLDFFYSHYSAHNDETEPEYFEYDNGDIEKVTCYFGNKGFGFEEKAYYRAGREPELEDVPDFFSVIAKTIINGELQGSILVSEFVSPSDIE